MGDTLAQCANVCRLILRKTSTSSRFSELDKKLKSSPDWAHVAHEHTCGNGTAENVEWFRYLEGFVNRSNTTRSFLTQRNEPGYR